MSSFEEQLRLLVCYKYDRLCTDSAAITNGIDSLARLRLDAYCGDLKIETFGDISSHLVDKGA